MSCYDLESENAEEIPVSKLISIIFKSQTIFLNSHLKELNISGAQLHVLFEVNKYSKINQETIASRSNTNKGAVARSIKKLEDNSLIVRTVDENNRRQNIITLTEEGKVVLDRAIEIFSEWENSLLNDIEDKKYLQVMLKDLAIQSIKLNENRFDKK